VRGPHGLNVFLWCSDTYLHVYVRAHSTAQAYNAALRTRTADQSAGLPPHVEDALAAFAHRHLQRCMYRFVFVANRRYACREKGHQGLARAVN
jgi:hypothetical protein